jgi:hypothetical protein
MVANYLTTIKLWHFACERTEAEITKLLSQLSSWLTDDASAMLATRLHDATPEESRVEESRVEESRVEESRVEESRVEESRVEESRVEVEVDASLRSAPSPKSPNNRGSRLSESWQPSPDNLHFAEQEGLSVSEIEREAARFRDYWISRPGVGGFKRDWSATWRNWIRNAIEQKGKSNGRNVQDDSKSASAAAGRLLELAKRGQFTFGPRPSLLPSKSDAVVELLPPGRRAQS